MKKMTMKKFLFAVVFVSACTGPDESVLMEEDWTVPRLADLVRESIPAKGWIPKQWVFNEFEGVPSEDIAKALEDLKGQGLYVGSDKVFWQ